MAGRTCEVPGCERKHVAKGLCAVHYERKRKTGTVHGRPKPVPIVYSRGTGEPAPINEAALRRGRLRRAIEDREAALRLRREDDLLRRGRLVMAKHEQFFAKLEKRKQRTRRCRGCGRRFAPVSRQSERCPECMKPAAVPGDGGTSHKGTKKGRF